MNEVIMIFTSMEQKKKRVRSNYGEFEIDVPQI